MGRCDKLLEKARNAPSNLTFRELCHLAECHGFELDRVKGSHHIFKSRQIRGVLTLQKAQDGKAKPYQVRQLLDHIDRTEEE